MFVDGVVVRARATSSDRRQSCSPRPWWQTVPDRTGIGRSRRNRCCSGRRLIAPSALIVRPPPHKAMRQALSIRCIFRSVARDPAIERRLFITHGAAELHILRAAAGTAQLGQGRGRKVDVLRGGDRRLQIVVRDAKAGSHLNSPTIPAPHNGRMRGELPAIITLSNCYINSDAESVRITCPKFPSPRAFSVGLSAQVSSRHPAQDQYCGTVQRPDAK